MKKYRSTLILILFFLSQASNGADSCGVYLDAMNNTATPKFDLVHPISSLSARLNLALPPKSRFISDEDQISKLIQPLQLFRPILEKFEGGQDLFRIFENGHTTSEIDFLNALQSWTHKYIPGYRIMTIADLKTYNFKTKYTKSGVSIFHAETGTLEDNYLFELYSEKIIPIFKLTDLISHFFALSRPKLRLEFEKLVSLYLRAQDLGDKSETEQLLPRQRPTRPYENSDRLSYISTITNLLLNKISFLATYDTDRKILVLMGSQNYVLADRALSQSDLVDASILEALDLGLSHNARALNYFLNQSELENPAVKGLIAYLQKEGLFNKKRNRTTLDNVREMFQVLNNILQKVTFLKSTSQLHSNIRNHTSDQSWLHFSTNLSQPGNEDLFKLVQYIFRFGFIEQYIKVAESDVMTAENRALRDQPGPLFR